jgi:hypothetical protein
VPDSDPMTHTWTCLGTIEKHAASIFGKLGLPASESDNRRVLAVLRYLGS